MGWVGNMIDRLRPPPRLTVGELQSAIDTYARPSVWDGEKFPGGFGPTQLLITDYWTLRQRSSQLFTSNLYARGLIERLVTNEINTGLHLEATPEEEVIGLSPYSLSEWSEGVETRFQLWAGAPQRCDHRGRLTFGQLQCMIRLEALIAGDVLIVLLQDSATKLPRLQLISGERIQTPPNMLLGRTESGHRVSHGVEVDADGRHVAYYVKRGDNGFGAVTYDRIAAMGPRSKRPIAWLVYGTTTRLDDVRGLPIMALALQSLRDIDRYRDAALRKALINAIIAIFIKRNSDKPASGAFGRSAVRQGTDTAVDSTGRERSFQVKEYHPGVVLDQLAEGEEPHGFMPHGTDEKFGEFEAAMLHTVAWGNGIPPEILQLGFSNNYSASQAAINEFKIKLHATRTEFGAQVCQPIYREWLISQVQVGRLSAPGMLEALRNDSEFETFEAWVSSDWSGNIKPAVDLSKLVAGYGKMLEEGLTTRALACRELTGRKYTRTVAQLQRENEMLADALAPLAALEPSPAAPPAEPEPDDDDDEDTDDERDDDDNK